MSGKQNPVVKEYFTTEEMEGINEQLDRAFADYAIERMSETGKPMLTLEGTMGVVKVLAIRDDSNNEPKHGEA